jgi:hypothetical protein
VRGRRVVALALAAATAVAIVVPSTAVAAIHPRPMRPVIVSGPVQHAVTVPVGQPLNAAQTEAMLGKPGLPTIIADPATATQARRGPSDIHVIIDGTVVGVLVVILTKVGEKVGKPVWKAAKKWVLKKVKGFGKPYSPVHEFGRRQVHRGVVERPAARSRELQRSHRNFLVVLGSG